MVRQLPVLVKFERCSVQCECGLTPSSGDTDMCGAGPWPGETVRNVLTAGLS